MRVEVIDLTRSPSSDESASIFEADDYCGDHGDEMYVIVVA